MHLPRTIVILWHARARPATVSEYLIFIRHFLSLAPSSSLSLSLSLSFSLIFSAGAHRNVNTAALTDDGGCGGRIFNANAHATQ